MGDIDVRRPASCPDNRIGHICGSQRGHTLVNFCGPFIISAETHQAEIGLHHSRINACHPQWCSQQILTQTVVDATFPQPS